MTGIYVALERVALFFFVKMLQNEPLVSVHYVEQEKNAEKVRERGRVCRMTY